MDVKTQELSLSVTVEAAEQLMALALARNGSFDNVADTVIKAAGGAKISRRLVKVATITR